MPHCLVFLWVRWWVQLTSHACTEDILPTESCCQPWRRAGRKVTKKKMLKQTNETKPFLFQSWPPLWKSLCTCERHTWSYSDWETLNMKVLSWMRRTLIKKKRNLKGKCTKFNLHSAFVFNSWERLDFYYCLSTPHFLLSPWLRTPSPFYPVPSQNSNTHLAVLWSETKHIWMVILKTFYMAAGKSLSSSKKQNWSQ